MSDGHILNLLKQDPSVTEVGIKRLFVPEKLGPGPSTKLIVIDGMPIVEADAKGNFVPLFEESEAEFDAVHSFAVVWRVLTMYRRALYRGLNISAFSWQWGSRPLQIKPYFGTKRGAWYKRSEEHIEFHAVLVRERKIYTCRSFDMLAHETGHAVLDSLKPGWYRGPVKTLAIHESFGDLSALFSLLSQTDICEDIVNATKGDLRNRSFLSLFAEEYGSGTKPRKKALRSADNTLTYTSADSTKSYALSEVLTGAIYDILTEYFEFEKDVQRSDLASTLYSVGQSVLILFVQAIYDSPDKNADMTDIANAFVARETRPFYQELAKKRLIRRELLERPNIETAVRIKEKVPVEDKDFLFCGDAFDLVEDVTFDGLQEIRGIGPKYEKALKGCGIVSVHELAKLSKKEVEIIDQELFLKGRIRREKWVEQAKSFL